MGFNFKVKHRLILIKLVLAVVVGVISFVLSADLYFIEHPLLQAPNFAEAIIALFLSAIAYFFFPALGQSITNWLELLIKNTVSRVLRQFEKERRSRDKRKSKKNKEEQQNLKNSLIFRSPPLILDTSSIIDGRILDVSKSGFITTNMIVPQFVLDELQKVADSSNELKRKRGRRGLEVLRELKKLNKNQFKVVDTKEKGEVDSLLVSFAERVGGKVLTVDFNLNRVSKVSGVKVLNVNDLANAIKTNVVPGEILKTKIIQKGKDLNQGVGYLEDGTMVVAENCVSYLGKIVDLEVQRVLQTEAGRMIFAKKL